MAIQYDAKDFRNAADYVETYSVFEDRDREIAVLLRQAADDMERERKYEYSQRRHDEKLGVDVVDMLHCSNIESATNLHGRFNTNGTIVRREVGEWEEVTDEE